MKWEKLGCVFNSDGSKPWMVSHAAVPVALNLGDGRFRIYCSTRNEQSCSAITFVEIDLEDPLKILKVSDEPVLSPGPLGFFDDHGVFAGSIIEHDDRLLMYYLGWNPGIRQPLFYCSVGLSESTDGGLTFRRLFRAPIIDRCEQDPWAVLLPCIMKEGGLWRMWYGSGIGWEEKDNQLVSYYNIRHAQSSDGLSWDRSGHVCIGLQPGEFNVAHPFVLRQGDAYRMWYSFHRGQGYRLGYAESRDGLTWTRMDDKVGITTSPSGWDSESISHAHLISFNGELYMLYNGNGFGRTGFGIARLINED